MPAWKPASNKATLSKISHYSVDKLAILHPQYSIALAR